MATLKKLMTLLSQEGLVEQRAVIFYNYTNGRTTSATGLQPNEIDRLCNHLIANANAKMDIKRKRVIAAQFGVFKLMNKKVSIEYVLACICRRGSVEHINELTPNKLDNIYNALLDSQKQLKYSDRLVKAHLLEQQTYN